MDSDTVMCQKVVGRVQRGIVARHSGIVARQTAEVMGSDTVMCQKVLVLVKLVVVLLVEVVLIVVVLVSVVLVVLVVVVVLVMFLFFSVGIATIRVPLLLSTRVRLLLSTRVPNFLSRKRHYNIDRLNYTLLVPQLQYAEISYGDHSTMPLELLNFYLTLANLHSLGVICAQKFATPPLRKGLLLRKGTLPCHGVLNQQSLELILCCEGKCLRSFHATVDAGSDSICESLGLSDEQVVAIQNFFCKNCQYKQHQCFACGKLGSSDKSTSAEGSNEMPLCKVVFEKALSHDFPTICTFIGALIGCAFKGNVVTTRAQENSRFYGSRSLIALDILLGSLLRPPVAAMFYCALADLY
ncbi:hypothetical protein LguiB_009659 [Lonicera macranthoides]